MLTYASSSSSLSDLAPCQVVAPSPHHAPPVSLCICAPVAASESVPQESEQFVKVPQVVEIVKVPQAAPQEVVKPDSAKGGALAELAEETKQVEKIIILVSYVN